MSPETADQFGDEVIEPVGVEHVELVGLITLPDEVLPNELYPRQRAIVSPDIARRYDCLPPPPDPSLSLHENVERNQPPGCAVSYRYYSLSFADGPAGVKPALDEFVRRVRPLNEKLATIVDTSGTGATAAGVLPDRERDRAGAAAGRAGHPTHGDRAGSARRRRGDGDAGACRVRRRP